MALIKCSECGHMISDRASTCPQCGAPVEKRIQCPECGEFMPQDFTICPNCGCPTNPQKNTYTHKSTNNSFQSYSSIEGMSFGKAIKICFQKYAQFSGRASRGEFWYFYLFSILPGLCNWIITTTFGEYSDISMVMNVLIIIFNIAIIIPMLSVSVRRLHEMNESLHPKSWMLESILLGLSSFLLFTIWCLPFAITSFIYANRVERLWESGDIEGAIHASEKAKKYFTIGAWIGIGLCLVLFLFIMILLIILYIIQ